MPTEMVEKLPTKKMNTNTTRSGTAKDTKLTTLFVWHDQTQSGEWFWLCSAP